MKEERNQESVRAERVKAENPRVKSIESQATTSERTNETYTSETRHASKVSWSMLAERPRGSKNPVGLMTPSSFSYDLRAVEALPWDAGAKAVALATSEATRASFMVSDGWLRNCERVSERLRIRT
jgi:hypothetical protein